MPTSSCVPSEASWRKMWIAKVPGRVKHFIWRLKHNTITSSANLVKKMIASSPLCAVCKQSEESIEHIFFLCPWTTPVWLGLQLCPVPNHLNITHFGV